jgi:penicillin amidase
MKRTPNAQFRPLFARQSAAALAAAAALCGSACDRDGVDGGYGAVNPGGDAAAPADTNDSPDTTNPAGPLVDLDPDTLDGPGKVTVDADGIPHIEATTVADAYYLQGWATARHRLYQMDLTRRRALGTRAEVLGADYERTDLQARALRFDTWADRTEETLAASDPELLNYFRAYAAGVNAWREQALAGRDGAALAPQFGALDYVPEPWTVRDSLAIEKLIAAGLSLRPDQDITLGLLGQLLGNDLFADIYRYAPFDAEYTVPDFFDDVQITGALSVELPPESSTERLRSEAKAAMAQQLAGLSQQDLAEAYSAARALDLSGGGSNNWVIAGEHTQSGAPIIAGDSHQGVMHPSVYYYVHVSTRLAAPSDDPGLDVIGASFPGIPFVVFGHNGRAAFMPTTSIFDAADAYLETFDADTETVRFLGEDVAVDARDEVIRVRKAGGTVASAEPKTYRLYDVPHHGPMLPSEALGLPIPLQVSLRWTGYRPRSLGRAFFALNRAQSFEEFRAALEDMYCGGQNWVYADQSGDIGYTARVDLPIREVLDPESSPVRLLPGEGGFEWNPSPTNPLTFAQLDSKELPWVKNPASGYVGTGNNDPVGQTHDNDPYNERIYLSGVFDLGTRAYQPRVRFEQARAAGKVTLEQVGAIQTDDVSRLGQRIVPFILNAAKLRPDLVTPTTQPLVDLLAGWNHRCSIDSVGASIFHAWLAKFAQRVLSDEQGGLLNSVVLNNLDSRVGVAIVKFLKHWLDATAVDIEDIESGALPFPSQSGVNFFDDQTTPDTVETRDQMILAALQDAATSLAEVYADKVPEGADPADPAEWTWGRWHVMQLVDPAEPVLPGASSAKLAKGGCLYTVDVADFDWLVNGELPAELIVENAASDRFVLELLPEGIRGINILPGGQDERPGSKHHNDQFQDFVDGKFRPLRYTPEELAQDPEAEFSF